VSLESICKGNLLMNWLRKLLHSRKNMDKQIQDLTKRVEALEREMSNQRRINELLSYKSDNLVFEIGFYKEHAAEVKSTNDFITLTLERLRNMDKQITKVKEDLKKDQKEKEKLVKIAKTHDKKLEKCVTVKKKK
jgi:chromosome segregation ATPase